MISLGTALRMSADMHRRSEFQGKREYFLGHFMDFVVLEIVEKGGGGYILLTASVKSSNKGSYLDFSLFSRKKDVTFLNISLFCRKRVFLKFKLWFLLVFMQNKGTIAENILRKGVLFNSQNDDGLPMIFHGSAWTGVALPPPPPPHGVRVWGGGQVGNIPLPP